MTIEVEQNRLLRVELSQQEIIEFCYVVADLLEPISDAGRRQNLFFECQNCYDHMFHLAKKLLGKVSVEYRARHEARLSIFSRDEWYAPRAEVEEVSMEKK